MRSLKFRSNIIKINKYRILTVKFTAPKQEHNFDNAKITKFQAITILREKTNKKR